MEKASNSFSEARSSKWIWVVLAIIVLCAAMGSCIVISGFTGVFLLRPYGNFTSEGPELQSVPPVQTVPVATSLSTEPAYIENIPVLNARADPLYGSVILQRGFAPDPHFVPVLAGGSVDTSDFDLECGFTTTAPGFAFTVRGGASAGFLRIYYVSTGDTDTALIVHTPEKGWVCMDDSSSGKEPVIDIQFAESGEYTVWVGTWQSNTQETGTLFITQSEENTP